MFTRTPLLTRTSDELTHVVPAEELLVQRELGGVSPYMSEALWSRIRISILVWLTRFLEWCVGSRLYVENEMRELYSVDARLRSLLLSFVGKKLITSWELLPCYPDAPAIIRYGIKIQFRTPKNKKTVFLDGYGVGNTNNEALFLALAETIERHASFLWDPSKIQYGTYEELRSEGACKPQRFDLFSTEQRDSIPSLDRGAESTATARYGWRQATGFIDGQSYLIPAQLSSVLYAGEHQEEPLLMDPSTNAFAAGPTLEHAVYGAVCEAIERDAIMGFWLNTIAPPRIALESIPFEKVRAHIETLKRYGYTIYFFDVTTDLKVPTFAAVLEDPTGETPVSISAVTGHDIERSFNKLILEIVKFAHYRMSGPIPPFSRGSKYPTIRTLPERRVLWSQMMMQDEISFFCSGEEHDLDLYPSTAGMNTPDHLEGIKRVFREKEYGGFIVEVTSPEAQQAGLRVVRAILPELIPIHFNELYVHRGVQRLFHFPVLNGYGTVSTTQEDINSIPHPFV